MVYIHCDKETQPLVFRGFWSTEQHHSQLKEQDLHHHTLHSTFVTIKLLDDVNDTHTPTTRYIFSRCLSLFLSLSGSRAYSLSDPLFPHSSFPLSLTLTVIIIRIGVTGSEGVRLTGNPYFLLSQQLITVEKTDDFSIPISQCPTYSAGSEVNYCPALKSSSFLFIPKLAQWEKTDISLQFVTS